MSNQFTCSSDDEQSHRYDNGIRRLHKRRMHNEVERRRKDKINSWILKIGELLPDRDSKRQSKNGILEKAVEYIDYLQKANEKLLMDKCTDVQVEEMRQMKKQVKELREQNSSYIKLLNAAAIPLNSTPEEVWSQRPGKYSNKFTPGEACALIDEFKKKKSLNGLLKHNAKVNLSVGQNSTNKVQRVANGSLNNSSSASDVETMIMSIPQRNLNIECTGDSESDHLEVDDCSRIALNVTSNPLENALPKTRFNSSVSSSVQNSVGITQLHTKNSDIGRQNLSFISAKSTTSQQCSTLASVTVIPSQVSLATFHATEAVKTVDSCNVRLVSQQQVIVVSGQNVPLLQNNISNGSSNTSSFRAASCQGDLKLQTTVPTGFSNKCVTGEAVHNETSSHQASSETLALPVPTASVISTSVLGRGVPSATVAPSLVTSSCKEIRPQNNGSAVCPSQVLFGSSVLGTPQVPGSCMNGYISNFNPTLATLPTALQHASQTSGAIITPTGLLQTTSEVSAQTAPYPCGILNQHIVQPSGIITGQQLIFNQQGQVISFNGNPLLAATGVQPQNSLPSALLLPNGQIIPVVSQPSVVYANPSGGVNSNFILSPSATQTNMPVAPIISTGIPSHGSDVITNNMFCNTSGNSCSNITQKYMFQVDLEHPVSSSNISGSSFQEVPEKSSYSVSNSKNTKGKGHISASHDSMSEKIAATKTHTKKLKNTAVTSGDKNAVPDVQASKTSNNSTVGTCKASQRPIKPKPSPKPINSNVSRSSYKKNATDISQRIPTVSSNTIPLTHETACVNNCLNTMLDSRCSQENLALSVTNSRQPQAAYNNEDVPNLTSEKNTHLSLSESQPLSFCSELSESHSNRTTDILAKATESIFSNTMGELSQVIPDFNDSTSLGDAEEEATRQLKKGNEITTCCAERSSNSPVEQQSHCTEPRKDVQKSCKNQKTAQSANVFSSVKETVLEQALTATKSDSNVINGNNFESRKARTLKNASNDNGKRTVNENPSGGNLFSANQNTPPLKRLRSQNDIETEITAIQVSHSNAIVSHSEDVSTCISSERADEFGHKSRSIVLGNSTQKRQEVSVNSSLQNNKKKSESEASTISDKDVPPNSFCTVSEVHKCSGAVNDITEISCVANQENSSELPSLLLGGMTEDSDVPSSLNGGSNPSLPFLSLSPPEHFGLDLHGKDASDHSHNMFNLQNILSSTDQNSRNDSERSEHVSSKMVTETNKRQKNIPQPLQNQLNNHNTSMRSSGIGGCSMPSEQFSSVQQLEVSSSTSNTFYPSTQLKYTSESQLNISISSHSFPANTGISTEKSPNIFSASSDISASQKDITPMPQISYQRSASPPLLSRSYGSHHSSNSVGGLNSPSSLPQTLAVNNNSASKDQHIQPKLLSPCASGNSHMQQNQNTSNRFRQRSERRLSGSKPTSRQTTQVSSVSNIVPSPVPRTLISSPPTTSISNSSFANRSVALQGSPSLSRYSAEALIGSASPIPSSPVMSVSSGSSFTSSSKSNTQVPSSQTHVQKTSAEQCMTTTLSYSAESLIQTQSSGDKRQDNQSRNTNQLHQNGQMNNSHMFQATHQHAYIKSFVSAPSRESSSTFLFSVPSEIRHECPPLLQVPSSSSQSASPRFASNFIFQGNSSNVHPNNIANGMAQHDMRNCNLGANPQCFLPQHPSSLSSEPTSTSNPPQPVGGGPPPIPPQPYPEFALSLGNGDGNVINPPYHRPMTNSHNFNTSFSTCLQNLPGNNLTSNISHQNQRDNFLANSSASSGHSGPFFQVPDTNFPVLTNPSSLSDQSRTSNNLGRTSFLGNCPQSSQNHLVNNFFPGHFIPGISDQKNEPLTQRGAHRLPSVNEMSKPSSREHRNSSHSRTLGPGQNKQNSSKNNKGSRKNKHQSSAENPSQHTLPVFDGNRNMNVASCLPTPELPNPRNDVTPCANSRCFGISQKASAPSAPSLPGHSPKNISNNQHIGTDIGNALFRSQAQNSLNQSSDFSTASLHRLSSAATITSSITLGSHNNSVCSHHVPNFNLSNIIPDINTSSAENVRLSPIKFNPSGHIIPPAAQTQVQPANNMNGLGHAGHHQNNHAPPSLYHGRTHPSVIHNSMSFNTFLGHNAHGFDGRPPAQMTVGINSTVAPPPPHFAPTPGHTPSFGNAIHSLNFSIHDQ
ncbi:uncharacterized protein LOC143257579 isoform X2 [Tachypleus tridentatus]|uniref:uncharacterized protein LOC143257579 isoform X2 n=1 Tax=Tachypleus tridentatus TaxID=6853 RepID=UPI003FD3CD00